MGTEPADQRYLLAREKDMWKAEAERTQNRINALQQAGTGAAIEQTWYDPAFTNTKTWRGNSTWQRMPRSIPYPTSSTLMTSTAKHSETVDPGVG